MQRGELVQWNDERGYGFILADSGERFFVHISSIGRIATRPRAGDLVSFRPDKAPDGRLQARSVSILGANPSRISKQNSGGKTSLPRYGWRLAAAGVLVVLIGLGTGLGHLPWFLSGLYLCVGLFAFVAYARDKRSAEEGHWRISETTLLAMDLCFGIVGGLLGQEMFRHKTRKPGYAATTLLITGVHLLWLAGLGLGLISVEELVRLLSGLVGALS